MSLLLTHLARFVFILFFHGASDLQGIAKKLITQKKSLNFSVSLELSGFF